MAIRRCFADNESTCDLLLAVLRKAFEYPKLGVHIGAGRHVAMPVSWNGQGETPQGWTKQPVAVWLNTDAPVPSNDAVVPFDDGLVGELQAAHRARLTGVEITRLDAAIAARVNKDIGALFVPKG